MRRFWKILGLGLCGGLGTTSGWAEIRETSVWWLPRNVSNFGHEIDFIFYVILWLTGITSVLVFGTMIYFIVKYRHRAGSGPSIATATTRWRWSGPPFRSFDNKEIS